MNRVQARAFIANFDRNGDGKVSYKGAEGRELSASNYRLLRAADRNNDGRTGVAELVRIERKAG